MFLVGGCLGYFQFINNFQRQYIKEQLQQTILSCQVFQFCIKFGGLVITLQQIKANKYL